MVPKFRGKTIKGFLVVGYVSVVTDKRCGVEPGTYISNSVGLPFAYEVIPETVGQSTGLKDKNGVDIFEGDIVFDRWANKYTPVFQNGIYMAYNPKNLMQNDPSTQFNIIWKDGCEVIGNIYENPELLEQADEN